MAKDSTVREVGGGEGRAAAKYYEDTIVAAATARGRAGVAVVRLSGVGAIKIAGEIFRPASGKNLIDCAPRRAVYGQVVRNGQPLDDGLCLFFPAPHSYTGEDTAEFQVHGSPVGVRAIIRAAIDCGARPAAAGEYTRRAFLNGKIDLLRARAVMDHIEAKTAAALKLAAGHLTGRASARIKAWRDEVFSLVVHLEALIDFPEEGLEEIALAEAGRTLAAISGKIAALLKGRDMGRILRDGLVTAIVGRPNVGKSSLLNALLREERAIVTDIAGTTRDSLEEYADLGGVPVRLIDTAGLRDTDDAIERLGIARSRAALARAELVLALFDSSAALSTDDLTFIGELKNSGKKVIAVLTKSDLPPALDAEPLAAAFGAGNIVAVSSVTGDGLEKLEAAVARAAFGFAADDGADDDGLNSTAEIDAFHKHPPKLVSRVSPPLKGGQEREGKNSLPVGIDEFFAEADFADCPTEWEAYHLERAKKSLDQAAAALSGNLGADCAAIDLENALESFAAVLGETASPDIIDEIFSRFCVGK